MSTVQSLLDGMDTLEIEKLVALARARGIRKAGDSGSSIPVISRNGPLPLSFSQQGLWLISQQAKASVIYHIPAALSLRGALDVLALRRALNTVFLRHEALRSVFVTVDRGAPGTSAAGDDGVAVDRARPARPGGCFG